MKNLIISEIFPPMFGGSGRWFWDIYSRLDSGSTIFAVGATPHSHEFDQNHTNRCYRFSFDLPNWGVFSIAGFKAHLALFLKLRSLVKKEHITVIHCGRGLPEGLLGWFASKLFGIPYLCYVHGEELPTYHSSREYKLLSQMVYKNARLLIVNSQNTRQSVIHYTGITDTIRVMHPGVDSKYFVPVALDPSAREQLGWCGKRVILTVGRMQKRKGHDHVILSLNRIRQQIPDILYAIVGDGEEREYLENLVDAEGVREQVQFLGKIDDAQMLTCYQQCDLFILANREVDGDFEGFGMVLVEAQSCGKPVIAGDSGGTAETMIPNETGLVIDATRPDNIADAVVGLLNDPDKLDRMGNKAVSWVRDNLDWEALVIQAKGIFSELDQQR